MRVSEKCCRYVRASVAVCVTAQETPMPDLLTQLWQAVQEQSKGDWVVTAVCR